MSISENYKKLRKNIPSHVSIVAAAKTRTADEISELIDAGAEHIGHNYVQESVVLYNELGEKAKHVKWHMIGNLQKNKVNKALSIFDTIQTVDSYEKAAFIDKRVEASGKRVMPVFLEINIGNEMSKSGIKPADHEDFENYIETLVCDISSLNHLKIEGVMTMGPFSAGSEELRHLFRDTKKVYDRVKSLGIKSVDMKYLSMGMTNSYKIAIEEGSNMVRIGTAIFGARNCIRRKGENNGKENRQ